MQAILKYVLDVFFTFKTAKIQSFCDIAKTNIEIYKILIPFLFFINIGLFPGILQKLSCYVLKAILLRPKS